jgi:hypothetical protein
MNQWQNRQQRDPLQLAIRIQVDAVAMAKFWAWVDIAHGEVSCLGIVEEIRDADSGAVSALLVTDLFLVKQKCSADETTMDVHAVAELMLSLEAQSIDSRKLRCWVHSHGSMSVFWSATDGQCVSGLANGDYLLSLVVNRKRDSMMRLDQFHPCHLYITDVVWEVRYPLIDGLAEQCLSEFKAKVTEDHHGMDGHRQLDRETQNHEDHRQLARDVQEHVQDLREAHERGALTMEDLESELEYYWPGEFDDNERPF